MEIQGLLSPNTNIDSNGASSQTKSAQGPVSSASEDRKLQEMASEQTSKMAQMLESVLSSVAELGGIRITNSRLAFSQDEDTGMTVIKIIDGQTDEVIRQIPPEEILSLKRRMGEIQGLLLDKKV